ARALSGGVAGGSLGPRPRRGRGAGARALRGARGADREEARRSHARSARRPDSDPRAQDRGGRDGHSRVARSGDARALRTHLRQPPGHAALPRGAGHRPGRELRDRRQAAVRRPSVRPVRRSGARDRRRARLPHASGGEGMTPPPPPPPPSVPEAGAGAIALPPPSRLQELSTRGPLRRVLPMLGPAFVAAIAYVDPGNFATNIAGGAAHGYALLWVILLANLIGMLIQNLSAKVGIATGRNLPELCREHLPQPASWGLWIQAEL